MIQVYAFVHVLETLRDAVFVRASTLPDAVTSFQVYALQKKRLGQYVVFSVSENGDFSLDSKFIKVIRVSSLK